MVTHIPYIPGITVAICTYNRRRHLADTLLDLSAQDADASLFDVLVINNNSTDDTVDWLEKQSQLQWVTETRQGLSHARNRALEEAKRTHTLFIDDDVYVEASFIGNWLRFLNHHADLKAAGGPISVHFDDGKPNWFPMVLAQMLGRHGTKPDGYRYPKGAFPHGGNMLVHTATARQLGGFHTGIGRTGAVLSAGEEKDFFRRLQSGGHTILHNPTSPLRHRVGNERLTPDYIERQARGIGHGDAMIIKDNHGRRRWYIRQLFKTVASLAVSLGYLLGFQPARARMVMRFRKAVLEGFRSAGNETRPADSASTETGRTSSS